MPVADELQPGEEATTARALSTRTTEIALHTAITAPLAPAPVHQPGPPAQRPPPLTRPGAQAPKRPHTAALAPTRLGAQAPRRPVTAHRLPLQVHRTTTLGVTPPLLTRLRLELGWALQPLARHSMHLRRGRITHLHQAPSMPLRRVAGRVAGVRMLHRHLGQRQHLRPGRVADITVLLRLAHMVLRRHRQLVGLGIQMMIEMVAARFAWDGLK